MVTCFIRQTKEWSDCRLVVAANAALALGLDPPDPIKDRDLWEHLVKIAVAEYGSAISPSCSDRKMGVVALDYEQPWVAEDLIIGSGVEINDPRAGFHCVFVAERYLDGLGIVGYEWSAEMKQFTFGEIEELLPARDNQNRRAYLFVGRVQPSVLLRRSGLIGIPPVVAKVKKEKTL